MPADDGLHDGELAPVTMALLRSHLRPALHPFVVQVTRQVVRPLGAAPVPAREARMEEQSIALGLAALLESVLAGSAVDDAAPNLAHVPALLSACFQNLDLLPPDDPAGDAVALLMADAIERLREVRDPSPSGPGA